VPFTPFHFGITLLLFAVLPFLDPLSLFVGAVIPDIEGITIVFIFPYSGLPLHGPFHSFLGAIVLGVITGGTSYLFLKHSGLRNILDETLSMSFTLKKSIASALLGTFSHIILDAPLYRDMSPFWPLTGNLFLNVVSPFTPYLICVISFITGLAILLIRFRHSEQFINRLNFTNSVSRLNWRFVTSFFLIMFVVIGGAAVSLFFLFQENENFSGTLLINKQPQFEVGQKFFYRTNNISVGFSEYYYAEDIFTVNGTREINGPEYYEVIRNYSFHFIEDHVIYGITDDVSNLVENFYYNVENGTCIGKTVNPGSYSNEDSYATDVAFFAPWMLGLEENLKWEMNDEDSYRSYKSKVLGREKVSSISCFKVKMQVFYKGNLREVRNYWIDCERRIMIEEEVLGRFGVDHYKYLVET